MACSWPSGGLSRDQRNPTWATDYRRCDGVHCCRGLLLGDAACLRADVGTGRIVVGVGNSCPGCADGSDAAGTVTVLVVGPSSTHPAAGSTSARAASCTPTPPPSPPRSPELPVLRDTGDHLRCLPEHTERRVGARQATRSANYG